MKQLSAYSATLVRCLKAQLLYADCWGHKSQYANSIQEYDHDVEAGALTHLYSRLQIDTKKSKKTIDI